MNLKNLIFLLTGIFYTSVFAQYYQESRSSGIGTPVFEYNINRQFNLDFNKSTILVFAEILYDDLTFIKSDSRAKPSGLNILLNPVT